MLLPMVSERLRAQCTIVTTRLQSWKLAEAQMEAERVRKEAAALERERQREEAHLKLLKQKQEEADALQKAVHELRRKVADKASREKEAQAKKAQVVMEKQLRREQERHTRLRQIAEEADALQQCVQEFRLKEQARKLMDEHEKKEAAARKREALSQRQLSRQRQEEEETQQQRALLEDFRIKAADKVRRENAGRAMMEEQVRKRKEQRQRARLEVIY